MSGFCRNRNSGVSPWSWIPTLYIAEGLPYFAVNFLTVVMYVNMGIPLAEMAFFTGWLYLPWVIKPFWSPFVDLFGTKKKWIVSMQMAMACCMAGVAFLLPTGFFFASTLAVFWLMAFSSATHDIAADGYYMLALSPHDQAAFVGIRSTFYRIASVAGQGGLVMLAGWLENSLGDIPLAWGIVFVALSVLFLAFSLYHSRIMPEPAADRPVPGVTARTLLSDFCNTFVSFFRKPGVAGALCFMLLYRLPEALCIKLVQPFMLSPRVEGGLGMSTSQVGFVNGTIGVVALLCGGIVGGLAIARQGLRRCMWPMALSLTLPCLVYCFLAMFQPESILPVAVSVAFEQFGYGFGFTAYMLYLIYFSRGESQTSHYAFCTAFMALGMMVPGMAAGWLYDCVKSIDFTGLSGTQGYVNFFWLVMVASLATFAACCSVKVSPQFGRKQESGASE